MDFAKKLDQIFSGTLTLFSILLGIFTLALTNSIELSGDKVTSSWEMAWDALSLISGLSIVISAIICALCYFADTDNMHPIYKKLIISLFLLMLGVCGLGIPGIGLMLYMNI